ncbi:MAG: DegT/DnrJ/EryC1/StrS family aminotransferase [Chloroflexota bacterium]|nr:DegT/DnrJ/EryC1/StrS family aminotransferase [Chloroflexota bacterium]
MEEIKRSPAGAVIRCQSCGCQVLQTRYLSIGPKIEGFEEAFASYVDAEHAVGVKLRRQRPAPGYH